MRATSRRDRALLSELCFGEEADESSQLSLAQKIFDVSVIYEALQTSVDHTVSSKNIVKEMNRIVYNMKSVRRGLRDDVRDRNVAELLGHFEVGELDVSEDAFQDAETLAHKATIVSEIVDRSLAKLGRMAEHFDYKSSLYSGGTPAKYAFEYAIHALGAMFEELNAFGHKASVSEITPRQSGGGYHTTEYDSPFHRFVNAFFRIFDMDQLENREGEGFGDAVRKSARRFKTAPNLYLLLHDECTAQQVIDFMIGIDKIK